MNSIKKTLLPVLLAGFFMACKEPTDITIKPDNLKKLAGKLMTIHVKSPDQNVTYNLNYSTTDQQWLGYTEFDSLTKKSTVFTVVTDTSGRVLSVKNAANTETKAFTYNIQGRLTEVKSVFPAGKSTTEKFTYDAGRLDYYTNQLFENNSSTYAEVKIYKKLSANAITVITNRPGKAYEEEDFHFDEKKANLLAEFMKKNWPFVSVEGFHVTSGLPVKSERIFEGSIFQYSHTLNAKNQLKDFTVKRSMDYVKYDNYLRYKMEYYE